MSRELTTNSAIVGSLQYFGIINKMADLESIAKNLAQYNYHDMLIQLVSGIQRVTEFK